MRAQRSGRGFTLIEVMIALVLLCSVALSVTSTLIAAQRARAVSERWMQAVLLAAEGVEQLRAGQLPDPLGSAGPFERSATRTPWAGHPGLQRLEVMVTWNDGVAHQYELVTLVRR